MRAAYVYFRDVHAPDGTALPAPEVDGWDVTVQTHVTIDHRYHRYGVTWGPYAQLMLESSVPGVDSYGYQVASLRAYYSWRLFSEHELELRTRLEVGRHIPFHQEVTLGSAHDLRGYDVDQLRGDARAVFRVEYSVPVAHFHSLSFRLLGFWDSGATGYLAPDRSGKRDYLSFQRDGAGWWRNDVGAGFRVYLNTIVLPLVGLDFGYGIEGRSPSVYIQIGLTDF